MNEHRLANLSTRDLEKFFFEKQSLYFKLSERAAELLNRSRNQPYREMKARWLYIKLVGKFDAYSNLYHLKK